MSCRARQPNAAPPCGATQRPPRHCWVPLRLAAAHACREAAQPMCHACAAACESAAPSRAPGGWCTALSACNQGAATPRTPPPTDRGCHACQSPLHYETTEERFFPNYTAPLCFWLGAGAAAGPPPPLVRCPRQRCACGCTHYCCMQAPWAPSDNIIRLWLINCGRRLHQGGRTPAAASAAAAAPPGAAAAARPAAARCVQCVCACAACSHLPAPARLSCSCMASSSCNWSTSPSRCCSRLPVSVQRQGMVRGQRRHEGRGVWAPAAHAQAAATTKGQRQATMHDIWQHLTRRCTCHRRRAGARPEIRAAKAAASSPPPDQSP